MICKGDYIMVNEKHRHIWVTPEVNCFCGCEDDEKGCYDEDEEHVNEYLKKFSIPGASKEKIHLHVIPEGLRLDAPRDEHSVYVSEYAFSCEVDADKTEAAYENGILTVKVPYSCPDPFHSTEPVKIK